MSTQSQTIGNLAGALAKAQAKLRGAVKDSSNPFFKSSYADLQAVWDACRVPLTDNGLAVVQSTDETANGTVLVTTLCHESGEYITGRMPVLPLKNEPQAMGSAISYARRYALAAMVGVYQTDDDGESAQARGPVAKQWQPSAPVQNERQSVAAKIESELKKATPRIEPQTAAQPDLVKAKAEPVGTGNLGAPFDLVLQKGPHAGKQIQQLTVEEARGYFTAISEELKAVNRSPATLRGPSRDIYYALQSYTEKK